MTDLGQPISALRLGHEIRKCELNDIMTRRMNMPHLFSFAPSCLFRLAVAMIGFGLLSPAFLVAEGLPDKNLETAIRGVLFDKKDPSKPLTDEDFKNVYILEAKGKGIKDLNGLEKCTNLQLLNLAKNEITDLTPIKDLKKIQSLDLSKNQIADIAPLVELKGLQFLELSDNKVTDIAPLKGLVKLSALYMAGNQVADLAPLSEITRLSSLDVAGNQVVDLKPLETVNQLSLLKLSGNKIVDIAPIAKQTQVRMLFIDRNQVTDLAPLVAAAKEDASGKKRFAPFLRLYLKENPLSEDAQNNQISALKEAGVRIEG